MHDVGTMKQKTIAELAALEDAAFERYMKRRGINGMAAVVMASKRRNYIKTQQETIVETKTNRSL